MIWEGRVGVQSRRRGYRCVTSGSEIREHGYDLIVLRGQLIVFALYLFCKAKCGKHFS